MFVCLPDDANHKEYLTFIVFVHFWALFKVLFEAVYTLDILEPDCLQDVCLYAVLWHAESDSTFLLMQMLCIQRTLNWEINSEES